MQETQYDINTCRERIRTLQYDRDTVRYALDSSRRQEEEFKDALTDFLNLGLSIQETQIDVTRPFYLAVPSSLHS